MARRDSDDPLVAEPRVAVGPRRALWVEEAIRHGGGRPVGLGLSPRGLVWTDASTVDELRSLLGRHPGIEWVQLPVAGVENMVAAGLIDGDRQWTSAKGAFAEPVAEHALALLLAGLRDLRMRARARSWGRPAGLSLFDQPVTVIGAGGVAGALLELLEPFRARVTVVRRHADRPLAGAIRTVGPDRIHDALRGARGVVLALALTPDSRRLIGRSELASMAPDAWLVNVARGESVDTDALVAALRAGRIGGAALDVTDPEPLPTGHPLWRLRTCLITPHTADTEQIRRPLLAARIAENVRRLAAGGELEGLVDPDLGY
jgi:phosphoglycerate dehydrogenase-like enzyme